MLGRASEGCALCFFGIAMQIRKLCAADIAQCLALYDYYIENTAYTFEEAPLDAAQFAARAERIARDYPFYVAAEGERVLGYGYLDVFNERSAYRFTADVSLYVEKDSLHRGIGGKLLAALEKDAHRAGIENLISVIASENDISLRFHEKHGFFCAGELKNVGLKFGQRHSVKYYQKCLRRSSQAARAPDTRADCDEKGELCGDFPKESKST